MWVLTIRSPDGEPIEYILKPGKNTLGRKLNNDIVITDSSASRIHAEIQYNPVSNSALINDLDSTNGTFLNRNRLKNPHDLNHNDLIRIGMVVINVQHFQEDPVLQTRHGGTRPLTRDLVVESYDSHAVLMFEAAKQLNTVLDTDMALKKLTELMQKSMGADSCNVVLADDFDRLDQVEFPNSIMEIAIKQRTALVIPDMMAEPDKKIRLGTIYMYKTNPEERPFNQQDMQLAVAIAHLTSLTLERVHLMEKFREEQTIRNLLQRFVAPSEVEHLWQQYLQSGQLPGLVRQDVSVMFIDIVDSTGLAEDLGAQAFSELLARFYKIFTEIIFEHDGLINKYMGDGIMALFGMDPKDTNPEVRAVRAGVDMLQAIRSSSVPNEQHFNVGIGINTGPVMAGYIGGRDRVEFTVLGDTVNVAARFEGMSKPNRLFIGPTTRAAISSEFVSARIGEMEIRGRTAPIQLYQVLLD
jgi:adenylate cyclase